MKLNIWILNHYASVWGTPGGTRHFDIARELVRRGHRVTIVASSFDHNTRKERKVYPTGHSVEEMTEGVRFIWVKTTPYRKNGLNRVWNMLTYALRAYRRLKSPDESPDVIIGSLMHPLAALVGCWLAQRYRCKFYFEERDLWPQTLIDLGKLSPWNPAVKLLAALELYLYRKADRIIVLFRKAAEYVEQRGVDSQKIVYLPNGVDIARHDDHHEELPADAASAFQAINGKFIAIYAGAHGLANNLDAVLDAARITGLSHGHIHYVLIGDGPEKTRLVRRKREEKLDNVTFLSPVPKAHIPAILQRAHVGLLPLLDSPVFQWGISPNKLYDYMAAALPVIVLCPAEDTDVERAMGGSVIKDDFAVNLALRLAEYADNPANARLMGLAARHYVERHHAWPVLAERMVRVLHQDHASSVFQKSG